MYPGMAKTAREEGFAEIADWFETLAKAEKSHAGRFTALLAVETSALTPCDRPAARYRTPTDGLAYDPEDPSYWDEAALHRETARVFDVCDGCRMCFKYCDTFPKLFAIADREHDGDAPRADRARDRPPSWTTASSASCARSVPLHAARRPPVRARLPQARPPPQGAAARGAAA